LSPISVASLIKNAKKNDKKKMAFLSRKGDQKNVNLGMDSPSFFLSSFFFLRRRRRRERREKRALGHEKKIWLRKVHI